MNIGVITSGGDAPGMNPCLAQIVKNAAAKGHRVFGYRRGFCGIRDNDYAELRVKDVGGWYKRGGTVLQTSRMPELKEEFWQRKLIEQLEKNSIEALLVLGGDGSFRGALDLHRIGQGLNFIGIPSTIDNNIYGSEYTLGFDTAINKQMAYIDDISDTGFSVPGRIFFVETLGAWDSYLTNSSVHMGMADFGVLADRPMSDEEILDKIKTVRAAGERDYVLVTFSEGTPENSIHRMLRTAEYVRKKLDVNVKCNVLGYQQRGGVPTAQERLHAAGFAKYAVEAADKKIMNKYVVWYKGRYAYVDLANADKKKNFSDYEEL
ncbi:MAG: ATP-dependent 6-phosphofructokinase [Spirochaetaceae bacterium]|jgi:6-phosphofructokinase 1|nr:ATP-dependent 6-phosphofructokinase [Spirochaetaceae bacterium]